MAIKGEMESNRTPSPTFSVHSEVIPRAWSASEYVRLKELELKMAQERREMAEIHARERREM